MISAAKKKEYNYIQSFFPAYQLNDNDIDAVEQDEFAELEKIADAEKHCC